MNFSNIFLFSGEGNSAQTEISIPNQSPIWNATMSFDIGNFLPFGFFFDD